MFFSCKILAKILENQSRNKQNVDAHSLIVHKSSVEGYNANRVFQFVLYLPKLAAHSQL